jgi:hypothetical protein
MTTPNALMVGEKCLNLDDMGQRQQDDNQGIRAEPVTRHQKSTLLEERSSILAWTTGENSSSPRRETFLLPRLNHIRGASA